MENTINSHSFNRNRLQVIIKIGLLGAIARIVMFLEVPLWFAPEFYKIDFSEVVVLIGTLALGIVPGIFIELIKILLNLLFGGSITGGVGELANLFIGWAMLIPAGLIYRRYSSKKGAIVGMALGTIVMTIIGSLINLYVLLPVYAKIMPLDAILSMGNAVNPNIVDLKSLVLFATTPFNLLKGVLTTVIVFLLYKKLSPILKKTL